MPPILLNPSRPNQTSPRSRPARGQRGFTLAELLVTMTILVLAMVAVFGLFDSSNHMSHVQTDIAEMQQALRISQQEMVRLVRMAGRGGLSTAPPLNQATVPLAQVRRIYQSPAIELRNNVTAANQRIDLGGTGATVINAKLGTDVLTLRGVFSSALYWVEILPPSAAVGAFDAYDPGARVVRFDVSRPVAGHDQDFAPLLAATAGEALIIVSALDPETYGVARLQSVAQAGNIITVTFQDGTDVSDPAEAQLMARLSSAGTFPAMVKVSHIGVLEEWRYFVRDLDDSAGLDNPVLTKARMTPGTEIAYQGDAANLAIEIANDVHDFQVALGYDSRLPGTGGTTEAQNQYFASDTNNTGVDDEITDNGSGTDDWLFNAAADDPAAEPWAPPSGSRVWDRQDRFPATAPATFSAQPDLKVTRISLLALAPRLDRSEYQAPQIQTLEDHAYPVTEFVNTFVGRRHRRQILQTIVDLRNAS